MRDIGKYKDICKYNFLSKFKDKSLFWCFVDVLLVGGISYGFMCYLIVSGFFPGSETVQRGNDSDKDVIAIIYGAVAAFIALMIPIHYTISLDILGKINSAESENLDVNQKNPMSYLLFYCHSAEVLVYAFGLFGASVFLEEAIVIGSIFHLEVVPRLHGLIIIVYGFALAIGVARNRRYRPKWYEETPTYSTLHVYYLCIRYITLILGAIWCAFLTISECDNINAVVALVLLTLYYLCWVILRLLFAPMTHTKTLLIGNIKRTRKGTWMLKNEKTDKSVTLTMNLTTEEDQPNKPDK